MTTQAGDGFAFARRVLIATVVVVAVGIVLVLVWYAADLLLLVFAGVLVSIPLRRFRRFLQERTGLSHGIALAFATLAVFAAISACVLLAADRFASHANEFVAEFQAALETLRGRSGGSGWVREAIERLPDLRDLLLGRGGVLSRLTGLASSTLGAIINAAIILIVGVYFAAQPALYSRGIRHLFPFRYRDRASEVLHALDQALGRWLIGRLMLMIINGTLTALALWAIGVPLALTLGALAGLLNFIPNFGPLIAAVPAVLIAFVERPWLALYTALIYLAIQMLDGYVLTPIVDRRSVEMPPVLTISAQLLLGVLFGFVGLLVASPLTASAMILVKMLYVEDVLGDRITDEHAAENHGPARAEAVGLPATRRS